MKNITFFKLMLLWALLVSFVSFTTAQQHTESFSNSTATASYTNNSFIGTGNITWSFIASRNGNNDANNSGISLPALMLRSSEYNSKITSQTISGGIGSFSIKLYKGFTGVGKRQVELFINGISKGVSTPFDDNTEHIFTVEDINIPGDIIIEVVNTKNKQIIIDDISWNSYSGTDPFITATPNSALFSTTIGEPPTTKSINIKGINLTEDIKATLSGTNSTQFNISPTSISQTGGTANDIITITYTPTSNVANHTALLTLSSQGATDVVVHLTGETKQSTGTFVKITNTNLEELISGEKYIIYDVKAGNEENSGALNNTLTNGTMGLTKVIFNNEKIENPPHSIIWTITGNTSTGYTLYSEEIGQYCELKENKSKGFSLNTNSTHTYEITMPTSGKVHIKTKYAEANNREIGISGSSDFRAYTTSQTLSLYKKEDSNTQTNYLFPHTRDSSIHIWITNNQINFKAKSRELIEVYTITGQKLIHTLAKEGINSINTNAKGVLIIKVGNKVSKVIL